MRRTIFHEDHDAFRGTLRQFVDCTLKPRYERHPPHRRLPAYIVEFGTEESNTRKSVGRSGNPSGPASTTNSNWPSW